jgi:hypothetical protein
MPLYCDNATPLMQSRLNLCDLKKMFLNMIHRSDGTNDLMEQRAQILFIYLAMARVGEVRFENYSDWDWHDALQVVNTWWTELKKLEKYSMPMVPDYESYLFDFYHSIGCFFAIENGLLRSSNQICRGLENVVFPSLFNVKTKNVAEKIQKNVQRVLRNHLNEFGY